MGAVFYRLRCVTRSRWAETLGLIVIVGVVSAAVLVFAAGAERTSSAPDRYTRAFADDVAGTVQQQDGAPATAAVAALPGVKAVHAITFLFGGMVPAGAGLEPGLQGVVFAGSYQATNNHLVKGREADPAKAGEFVATRGFVQVNHLAIGDSVDLKTLTQQQADTSGFNVRDPKGPSLRTTLVGIIDGPAHLDDPTPAAVVSSAFLRRHPGVAVTIMAVSLRDGVALPAFRRQLDSLPNHDALSLAPAEIVSPSVRQAVHAQGEGLWVLAGLALVAAAVALGQLITRHVRLSEADWSRLSAMGFTRGQVVAEAAGRAAGPVLAGVVLGAVASTLLSSRFPTGFVRLLEPSPGLRVAPFVLLATAAALLVGVMACSLVGLLVSGRGKRAPRASTIVEGATRACPTATSATGVRFAFTRFRRDAGTVRATVVGLVFVVGALAGSLTFATSLTRLVRDPARYGSNFDVMFAQGESAVPPKLLAILRSDPEVTDLALYANGEARSGSETVQLVGLQPERGDLSPRLSRGRMPVSDDEIALGRLAAKALRTGVGDVVTLAGADGPRQMHVTGLAVIPSLAGNEGVGQDGVLTLAGLRQFDSKATPAVAVVTFRHGVTSALRTRYAAFVPADDAGADDPQGTKPAVIVNLSRVRSIPFVLAGLLGALSVLTVAHEMIRSVRNRRRDVAVLRSMGADRAWIARMVHWQATALVVLPIVIGVPVGLIAGQVVFRLFADRVGAVDDAAVPFVFLALVAGGLLVLANVAASLPARHARRLSPADLLRAE